jgi:hypothetical protein
MNAGELIELLKHMSPETKIVIRGYEDGFNDILELKNINIIPTPDAEWYYGEYAISDKPNAIEAVELYGENRKAND